MKFTALALALTGMMMSIGITGLVPAVTASPTGSTTTDIDQDTTAVTTAVTTAATVDSSVDRYHFVPRSISDGNNDNGNDTTNTNTTVTSRPFLYINDVFEEDDDSSSNSSDTSAHHVVIFKKRSYWCQLPYGLNDELYGRALQDDELSKRFAKLRICICNSPGVGDYDPRHDRTWC